MTTPKHNALALFQKSGLALASFGLFLAPATVQAQVSPASPVETGSYLLDWDEYADTGVEASQVNTFDIEGGIVDITFLNPENFASFEGADTPQINSILNGDNPDSDQSLHLQIDPEDPFGQITMETRFSGFRKSLVDVSFLLYDVDISNNSWQDVVTLTGYGSENDLVNPIFEVLGSTYEVDGSELTGNRPADNDGATGNVRVSFSGINGFDLEFADGQGTNSHGIGVGDIEVEDVPEPAAAVALGIFALAVFSKRKVTHA